MSMKCPNCGNELEEGKLLCENCGEEVKIVPDFDIELETRLKESISSMLEDIAVQEQDKNAAYNSGEDLHKKDFVNILKITAVVLLVVLMAVLTVVGTTAIARYKDDDYKYNSFDYQYGMAVACAEDSNYSEAVSYLERALALNSEDLDARFLLAKYYDKNGQQQSTIALLKELLAIETDPAKRDEMYDMLAGIYESMSDYAKIGDLLKTCDVSRIATKYNKYAALEPEFNKQGGVYDELISVTLAGNTQGSVYYTLDGTPPTSSSAVYETPILLETGDYTIRAMFVNLYGVESDVATQHYYINVSVPVSPVINPESGSYTEAVLIEAYYDNNTKIYYTTDGSVPNTNSSRYTEPVEMPYGVSNFSFVSINEAGLGSEVVSRSYQLEIQANLNAGLAIQVLKNNLCAAGKLLNTEGNVPDRPGINQYRVQTLYKAGEAVYYIIYESYMDTTGTVGDTSSIYAIDANTAGVYRAYKVDEGKYNLRPFAE